MLYITGENENLQNLMKKEGYDDTFPNYCRAFNARNPNLFIHVTLSSQTLPSYVPVILVTTPLCTDGEMVVREINSFSLNERQTLRKMQEAGYDLLSQIVLQDIMEDLQEYSAKFRQYYDNPLVTTPWTLFNQSLTNASLPDILGEMSFYSAQSLKNSSRLLFFDSLYDNLMKRDDLNRRLLLLKGQQGAKASILRNNLEKEIKDLTRDIKSALNTKIYSKTSKYLSSFGQEEIRKMKIGSYSQKMARKEQLTATRLDLLNKSGTSSLKKLISRLKVVGDSAEKISTTLGVAAVAYDVGQAYYKGNDVSRAFLSGTAGIATTMAINSTGLSLASIGAASLTEGAMLIGGVSGEVGMSVGILLCTPAGVVVLTVAGAAVVGYASYKVSEVVGELWDEYGHEIKQKASKVAEEVYQEILSAWRHGKQWVLDIYGVSPHYQR